MKRGKGKGKGDGDKLTTKLRLAMTILAKMKATLLKTFKSVGI